jgi:hypothetical protein
VNKINQEGDVSYHISVWKAFGNNDALADGTLKRCSSGKVDLV